MIRMNWGNIMLMCLILHVQWNNKIKTGEEETYHEGNQIQEKGSSVWKDAIYPWWFDPLVMVWSTGIQKKLLASSGDDLQHQKAYLAILIDANKESRKRHEKYMKLLWYKREYDTETETTEDGTRLFFFKKHKWKLVVKNAQS